MSNQLEIAAFENQLLRIAPHNAASVREYLLAYASGFGFDSFVITELPPVGIDLGSHIILSAWPQPWYQRYTSLKHYDNDPVARQAWNTIAPFVWSEALAKIGLTPKERHVMDEASDFGLCDGLIVPLHTISGFSSCISLAGSQLDLPPRAIDATYLVAIHAYEAVNRLQHNVNPHEQAKRSEQKLTPREREVLSWVARGRTDKDIGTICGISRKTVSSHVTNAAEKLGALNRTHATVEALIVGEIKASELP